MEFDSVKWTLCGLETPCRVPSCPSGGARCRVWGDGGAARRINWLGNSCRVLAELSAVSMDPDGWSLID